MSIETYNLDPVNGMVQIENIATQQEEMADMTTPISELVNDSQIVQEQSAMYLKPPPVSSGGGDQKKKKSQGSLTPEQMDAIIAGISAIVAFSKPVQTKLVDMIPGDGLMTMFASALVAAIVFFFAKRFLLKRQ